MVSLRAYAITSSPTANPGGRRPDRGDHPGHVPARDQREVMREPAGQVPLADLPVGRVHPGGVGGDQHAVRAEYRLGQVLQREYLRTTEPVQGNSFHEAPSISVSSPAVKSIVDSAPTLSSSC